MVREREDEFKAMGVVACPHCGKMIATDDSAALNAHIWEAHPDIGRKLQLDLLLRDLCNTGLIRMIANK